MNSTDPQKIEEQDFLESFALLPAGFILIKHPTPNRGLVEIDPDTIKELNKAKWIAVVDYNSYRGSGLTLNKDGLQSTFKYFAIGKTAKEAVAKLIEILPS